MKLVLVISSLGMGGAERALTTMANFWVNHEKDVTILTFADRDEHPSFPLDPRVKHCPLGLAHESHGFIEAIKWTGKRVVALREAISGLKPDAVVSFIDQANILALLATTGMRVRVVIAERTDPGQHYIGGRWKFLRRLTYPRASALVTQTRAALEHFPPGVRRIGHVIPNPVPPLPSSNGTGPIEFPGNGNHRIMALGRLGPEKGFDLLIRAFAQIAGMFPDWDLVIYGEGAERQALEFLRDELALKDRIFLPGRTDAPSALLREADLFVLSSRYEGFPNALCEAMAVGTAVVATDCRSGPADIVRPGQDGLLIPPESVDAMAKAMQTLMSAPEMRERLGEAAREVTARFDLESVMARWDGLLTWPEG